MLNTLTLFSALVHIFLCQLNHRHVSAIESESKTFFDFEAASTSAGSAWDTVRMVLNESIGETLLPSQEYSLKKPSNSQNVISEIGLLMVVKNPKNFITTFAKVFRTNESFGFFMDLQWHLRRLHSGSVVACVVSGAGAVGLRNASIDMRAAGSFMAGHLTPTSHWVWIFINGGKTLLETAVVDNQSPVLGHVQVSRAEDDEEVSLAVVDEGRAKLCDSVGVMGDFCDPAWKPYQRISLAGTDILEEIPVIVTAGQRPHYLYETIKSMFAAPGFRAHKVHVFVGNYSASTVTLLEYFGLNYTVIQLEGKKNAMLFQYYRKVFTFTANFFPNANAVIVIDEDVVLSPDFFSYMSQVIPVLLHDKTLYCASAFGFFSVPGLYPQRDKVRRGDSQVGWGYAIKMSIIRKALRKWPVTLAADAAYDFWLYINVVEGMECIYPELSRSKHFGIGVNAVATHLEHYFLAMKMESRPGVKLSNLADIPLPRWRAKMQRELENSEIITGFPCSPNFFTGRPKGSYIFPYRYAVDEDGLTRLTNYFMAGFCCGGVSISGTEFGVHDYVALARITPAVDIYFVGVPMSSFSYLIKNSSAV